MKKYRIYYTETTTNEIDIEAETAQEAIEILRKNAFTNGPCVESYEREVNCMAELDEAGDYSGIIRLPGFVRT